MTDLREQLQQTFGAAYTIERELGGGGMSRVFVAVEHSLERRVAVKVLPAEMSGQMSVERFKREIGIAARLQHAHLVPVLSAGSVDGIPYFIMPFVDGESLRDRIARQGELPLTDAIRILRDVASALAYSHDQGVLHRDIKPENVLLSGGAAMVTDFGVAKAVSVSAESDAAGLTSVGVALGTPLYMSPEQVSADPHVDFRADIYAWGVMAYELLTGQHPYAGRPMQAVMAAHVTETPAPIATRRVSIPPPLGQLVMQCLEKRPADRPQSAAAIVRALDAIPSSPAAPTAFGAKRSARWPRRASWTGAIVAVLALAVLGARALRGRAPEGRIQSLAVMPLVTGADSSDYFADGIIETLIAALAKVPGLEVRSSATSLALKGRKLTDAQVGTLLNVTNILHVSVRRSPSLMRVIVDLARVRDGTVLWADQQERPVGEVFAVQDSIARRTAAALAIRLGTVDAARVASFGTQNIDAYDDYLRGRHEMVHFDETSLRKALVLFDSALAKDPRYSLAYSASAEAWVSLSDDWIPPKEGYARAEQSAAKALALDSTNGQARGMLALARVTLHRDFERGLHEAELGFHRDSLKAESAFTYAALLAYGGYLDSAVVIAQRAIALDPTNASFQLVTGWSEFSNGHLDRAIARYRKALELEPGLPPAWNSLGEALTDAGRPKEGLAALARGEEQIDAHRSALARTLVALGRTPEARQVTAALVSDASRRYVSGDYIAAAYVALGDTDQALRWLEGANDARSQWILNARTDPRWTPLRNNPRFRALVTRIRGS